MKFRYFLNMGQEGELFCKWKLLDQTDVEVEVGTVQHRGVSLHITKAPFIARAE